MVPLHIHHEALAESGDLFHTLLSVFEESLYICLLVMAMMILIEIFNVSSHGRIFRGLESRRFGQIVISALLGLMPGCLGGFAGVSLYSHRIVGFGALAAMLIATTGDESFLMLTMFPGKAAMMMAGLFVGGVAVGCAVDAVERSMRKRGVSSALDSDLNADDNYEIHACDCGHGHAENGGHAEEHRHNLAHFLREHVWHHVVRRHLPAVFAWTFGVMAVFGVLSMYVDVETWIRGNVEIMILLAVAVGLVPESGPHMVFVTMFASGVLPFPVLLANSIAQDGHACLPLLAENRRSFVRVKCLKSVLALAAGFVALALGNLI